MQRSLSFALAPCLAAIMASCWSTCAAQQHPDTADQPRFIRIQHGIDGEPARLQTSIVRLQSALGSQGLTVDLIGAVHVGDADYYANLNRQFKNYDVVLYELVAPKGARPGSDERSQNPISMLQSMSQSMMNLESQLEHIDYSADNFVHADMTPEEIGRSMEARGDTTLSVALDVMADLIRQSNVQQQRMRDSGVNPSDQPDLLSMLFAPDRDVQMKRMMAEQFAAMGALDTGLGPTLNKMLIADRNAAAMRVFQQEAAKGRKKIAIFYGAAHMPDFAQRLKDDFGLHPKSTTWLTAWDLNAARPVRQQQADPLMDLLRLLGQ